MDSTASGAVEEPTTYTVVRSLLEEYETLTLQKLLINCRSNPRHIKRAAQQLAAVDDEPIVKCTSTVDGVTYEHSDALTSE